MKKERKYVGNKAAPGVFQTLANAIPASNRYFSFFGGGGGLEFSEAYVNCNWVISEPNKLLHANYNTLPGNIYTDYKCIVSEFEFSADDFIFCDPPYKLNTRRSGKIYYKHEFTDLDHAYFLECISCLDAKILITHPMCAMYNKALENWYRHPFQYQTRQGLFFDTIWSNYDIMHTDLHTLEYLGKNRNQRQSIKKQNSNIVRKIENLPFHRQALLLKSISNLFNSKKNAK